MDIHFSQYWSLKKLYFLIELLYPLRGFISENSVLLCFSECLFLYQYYIVLTVALYLFTFIFGSMSYYFFNFFEDFGFCSECFVFLCELENPFVKFCNKLAGIVRGVTFYQLIWGLTAWCFSTFKECGISPLI